MVEVGAAVQPLSFHMVPPVWRRPPTDLPPVLSTAHSEARSMLTRRGSTHFEWRLLLAVAAGLLLVRQLTMMSGPEAVVPAGWAVQSPADPLPADLAGKLRPASVP